LREGKTRVPGEKPLRAEKRTNKLNPRMTPRLEIVPGPHWWEASALTTTPPRLSNKSGLEEQEDYFRSQEQECKARKMCTCGDKKVKFRLTSAQVAITLSLWFQLILCSLV